MVYAVTTSVMTVTFLTAEEEALEVTGVVLTTAELETLLETTVLEAVLAEDEPEPPTMPKLPEYWYMPSLSAMSWMP